MHIVVILNTNTVFVLQIIWKCFFGNTSRHHGTLGYFKSLLNCTPVKNDPKKDVNATVDFFLTVLKAIF